MRALALVVNVWTVITAQIVVSGVSPRSCLKPGGIMASTGVWGLYV